MAWPSVTALRGRDLDATNHCCFMPRTDNWQGEDHAQLENLSHETLHQIVPLLGALGAGVLFGQMNSGVVEGGFREQVLGADPFAQVVVGALPEQTAACMAYGARPLTNCSSRRSATCFLTAVSSG